MTAQAGFAEILKACSEDGVDDFLCLLVPVKWVKNKDTCTELCQAGFPRPGG